MTESIKILEAQIRECYGRVAYTHKTQECCADIIRSRGECMKISQIILSAVISASFLSKLFGSVKLYNLDFASVFGAVISMILIVLSTYLKDYDIASLVKKHSECAAELLSVRESYLSLLTEIKAGIISSEEVIVRRDKLQVTLDAIYKNCPRTIRKAYKRARKKLKFKEELTFSAEEIDQLLPNEIRKGK